MTADTAGARRLTLVVSLAHAGFIHHYRPVLELLAERGHRIYVAFSTLEKDTGDARLAEDLAATHDGVTTGLAAQRDDRWRAPAALARSLIDLARYADPRYAAAPELRARAAREVSDRVRAGRRGPAPSCARPAARPLRRCALVGCCLAAADPDPRGGRAGDPHGRGASTATCGRRRPDTVVISPVIEFGRARSST